MPSVYSVFSVKFTAHDFRITIIGVTPAGFTDSIHVTFFSPKRIPSLYHLLPRFLVSGGWKTPFSLCSSFFMMLQVLVCTLLPFLIISQCVVRSLWRLKGDYSIMLLECHSYHSKNCEINEDVLKMFSLYALVAMPTFRI